MAPAAAIGVKPSSARDAALAAKEGNPAAISIAWDARSANSYSPIVAGKALGLSRCNGYAWLAAAQAEAFCIRDRSAANRCGKFRKELTHQSHAHLRDHAIAAALQTFPASIALGGPAQEAVRRQPGHQCGCGASGCGTAFPDADAQRARSLYLPRLNGFARYDWNSALRPFGGDNNWTVGVMASWTPFAGASELSDVRAATSRRAAADAMRDGAEATARLDAQQSATTLRVALARLEIAERGVQHGIDAHRIVGRRYAGGLAAVVELLDAAAMETQSRLALAGARYALLNATVERRRLLGLDPGALRSLDDAPLALRAPIDEAPVAPPHF